MAKKIFKNLNNKSYFSFLPRFKRFAIRTLKISNITACKILQLLLVYTNFQANMIKKNCEMGENALSL
jgi:hypothetical protein